MTRIPAEFAPLVAALERNTGQHITVAEAVSILPPANGSCMQCGAGIQFIAVRLCDPCLDERIDQLD